MWFSQHLLEWEVLVVNIKFLNERLKRCPIMEKSVQFCQMGLRRDFFITFNVLQAHLLKTLYYCIFDTNWLIRGHMKKGTRE